MKGILFKPDMIQAIIEGRETQTRRLSGLKEINEEPNDWELVIGSNMDSLVWLFRNSLSEILDVKPRYQVGETVYIKEAWATEKQYDHLKPSEIPDIAKIFYASDGVGEWPIELSIGRLRSALHLPEEFARYFILIKDVRAERLQDIIASDSDMRAEGIPLLIFDNNRTDWGEMAYQFENIWNCVNKDYPWASNPWCFVYTFQEEKMK